VNAEAYKTLWVLKQSMLILQVKGVRLS